MTSASQEDYLRAIYELTVNSPQGTAAVTTNLLAARLSVAAPSVTGMIRKLAEAGLVRHAPYQGVELTRRGERAALDMVRRHRLLEVFLVRVLDYAWDEVHEEAHRLEHAVSGLFIERVAAILGQPESDPHGEPIPTADGHIAAVARRSVLDMETGSSGQIVQVTDENSSFLRYLDELGLRPGTLIRLVERAPFEGPLKLQVGDREAVIGPAVASQVRVEPVRRR
jgi:DtxR family transcriptional regulator, Mn-dependent transcriptional regulator